MNLACTGLTCDLHPGFPCLKQRAPLPRPGPRTPGEAQLPLAHACPMPGNARSAGRTFRQAGTVSPNRPGTTCRRSWLMAAASQGTAPQPAATHLGPGSAGALPTACARLAGSRNVEGNTRAGRSVLPEPPSPTARPNPASLGSSGSGAQGPVCRSSGQGTAGASPQMGRDQAASPLPPVSGALGQGLGGPRVQWVQAGPQGAGAARSPLGTPDSVGLRKGSSCWPRTSQRPGGPPATCSHPERRPLQAQKPVSTPVLPTSPLGSQRQRGGVAQVPKRQRHVG